VARKEIEMFKDRIINRIFGRKEKEVTGSLKVGVFVIEDLVVATKY
jgi:hypothetical protein